MLCGNWEAGKGCGNLIAIINRLGFKDLFCLSGKTFVQDSVYVTKIATNVYNFKNSTYVSQDSAEDSGVVRIAAKGV